MTARNIYRSIKSNCKWFVDRFGSSLSLKRQVGLQRLSTALTPKLPPSRPISSSTVLEKQPKFSEEPLSNRTAATLSFPTRKPPTIPRTGVSSYQTNSVPNRAEEVQMRRSRLQRQEVTSESHGHREYPSQVRMGISSRPATLNMGRHAVGSENQGSGAAGLGERRAFSNSTKEAPKIVGVRQKVTDL